MPTQRKLTLDVDLVAEDAEAEWVDPASGARQAVPLTREMTPPGRNADGGGDWLLLVRG